MLSNPRHNSAVKARIINSVLVTTGSESRWWE
jgi:hypothetical protein